MKVVVMAEVEVESEDTESACKAVRDVLSSYVFGVESEAKAWVKPDAEDRDPRVDPKPGDLVFKDGTRRSMGREVRRVEAGVVQYVSDGSSHVCGLATWLNWCRGAKLLKEIEDEGKPEEGDGVPVVQVRERGLVPLVGEP